MRGARPLCDQWGMQNLKTKETNMKRIEKGSSRETRPLGGARRRTATSLRRPGSIQAAAERQIAEIERTFTLRYEW